MVVLSLLFGVSREASEFIDFLIHTLDAIPGIRVIGQKLRRVFALGLALQFLKKLRHGARIVTGVVERLRSQYIRLGFVSTRVVKKNSAGPQRNALCQNRATGAATQQPAGNPGRALRQLPLGGLRGSLPQPRMTNL